ncbi:hypothetical protein [Maribellus sp. YY47]|uniref:hypothetical protein n=1 Tax=Maribellus sp. YY47 TaxID=2929486 RepID=UPI002000DF16|nr:hypothetical protein [Maribellus sp. YY47]MCK3683570.1 hypothetical protein [Maribellus sp. YY47]
MTKILSNLLILFLIFSCIGSGKKQNAKDVEPSVITAKMRVQSFIPELPDELQEVSGLLMYRDLFWGFNDSGGKNVLYAFNRKGEIQMEVEIENAMNQDWESITQDAKHIYIGDFGNNHGSRKNLRVYKIKKKDIHDERRQKLKAEEISFEYNNQQSFVSPVNGTAYDCEAMAFRDGKLHLFSKNWKDRITQHYALPVKKGSYQLEADGSFNVRGLVTGADFSPDGKTLALLQYENWKAYLWLFSNFKGEAFFAGKSVCIYLDNLDGVQTEGISFLSNDSVLISCEQTKSFRQQVFLLDLNELKNGTHPN